MWNNFEHQIWNKIKEHNLDQKKLLLTVSGGLDSMVLLSVMSEINFKNTQVLHFHHGDFENKTYRDQASELIRKKCSEIDIPFETHKSMEHLKSEADFRSARKEYFNTFRSADSVFVTGHHLDDLLETRLIKMIRGAGVDGLRAFSEYNGEIFRPFLNFSKNELEKYAVEKNMTWVEDPTNSESDYLRNWIRNQWLPALNEKHTGGIENLAKSLDRILILDQNIDSEILYLPNEIQIPRMWFFGLSTKDQLKVLSKTLSYFKKIEFSLGNLEEINKRLDKNQKEHIFELYSMNWVLNAQQIMVRFTGSSVQ